MLSQLPSLLKMNWVTFCTTVISSCPSKCKVKKAQCGKSLRSGLKVLVYSVLSRSSSLLRTIIPDFLWELSPSQPHSLVGWDLNPSVQSICWPGVLGWTQLVEPTNSPNSRGQQSRDNHWLLVMSSGLPHLHGSGI